MKRTSLVVLLFTLLLSVSLAQGQEVRVDSVTGLDPVDTTNIIAGQEATFWIELDNSASSTTWTGITNGFRIYSPDGATWSGIAWDTVEVSQATFQFGVFFNDFSTDGMGADTVGFGALGLTNGLAAGTSITGYKISLTPDLASHQQTLCIDSSWYPPGGTWKWAVSGGASIAPGWNGPHCFTVLDPNAPTNDPPVLADIGAQAVNEGQLLEFGVTATDPNADPLTLDAAPLPDGATFTDNGDGTGQFSWMPGFDQAGAYDVTFSVSDGQASDSEVVTITVTNTALNLAVDPASLSHTVTEGAGLFSDSVVVTETGGNNIPYTVNLLTASPWLTPDAGNGTTPDTLGFAINPTGLTPDTYVATVELTSADADNSPLTFDVTLVVEPAPTAQLQVIHNAADPAAALVDVFVNGDTLLTGFGFREATSFLEVPAETDLTVALAAPGDPTPLAEFVVNLAANGTFVAVANGVLDDTQFEANPDAVPITLNLFAFAGQTAGLNGLSNVDFSIFHGSTDAPTVDVIARGVATLADNLTYGQTEPYQTVPAGAYVVDITPGDDNTTIVKSYDVDLSGLGGGAAVVFASGFLTPDNDQNGPAFGLFAALPDGTVVQFNEIIEVPDFVLTPDTLTFLATEAGSNPDPQSFLVELSNAGEVTYTVSTTAPWIGLGGTDPRVTPSSVAVTIDISGLAPGTYLDSILVEEGGADPAGIAPVYEYVVLEVAALPEFVLTPDTTFFTAVEGGANPDPESFLVELSNAGEVTYTASTTAPWLGIGGADPRITPSSVALTADITGLTAGTYFDSVLVEETGADLIGIDPVYEYVQLTVTEAPRELVVAPDTLEFATTEGINPPSDSFNVSELGGAAIEFVTSAPAAWITATQRATTTPAYVDVDIDVTGVSPGTYVDSIEVAAAEATNSPQYVYISLDIAELPSFVVDPTNLPFSAIEGGTNPDPQGFQVELSNAGQVTYTATTDAAWIGIGGTDPRITPSSVAVTVDITGLPAGLYTDTITITETGADPIGVDPAFVQVQLTIAPPPSNDTVIVETAPAVPGMRVEVPVIFSNSCDLSAATASLSFTSGDTLIVFDSAVFAGGAFADWTNSATLLGNEIDLASMADGAMSVAPGSGQTWVNLWFTVSCDAPAGNYPITLAPLLTHNFRFTRDCGEGDEVVIPEFVAGGINVDTTANFVCGWVVDPNGTEIEGATVELWADFPFDGPLMTTTSSGIGSFAFSDFTTVPFDIYAYKDGYYPNTAEDLNFGDKGVKITLSPLEELTPTSMWVDYFCDANTLFGAPLPIGSVVEARVASSGLLVGQYVVDSVGQYGFMPVYRASTTFGDDGAVAGDELAFFVNQLPAVTSGNTTYPETDFPPVEVCLEVGNVRVKECPLVPGWNLVSWNVDTETDDIMTVLGPYMSDIDVVLGFEQGGLTFDPTLPQFSTLDEVDHLSGYWIKVKDGASVTLMIEGFQVEASTPIPVTTGWNLVSYLPETALDVQTALQTVSENLMFAYGFPNGGIEIYQPGSDQFNQLDTLRPCNGYWLKLMANDVLAYPSGSGPAVAPEFDRLMAGQAIATATDDVVKATNWVNLYSSNLTVDGDVVAAGATIEAWTTAGEKVGAFTTDEAGTFGFMPVYAGTEAPLKAGETFTLTVDGIETKEEFEWTNNGDRIEITNLTAKSGGDVELPVEYSLAQNYPNPFNPTTTISFSLPNAGEATIEIYNILGERIATPFDGMADAGENTVVWDGRNASGEQVASGVYLYRLTADKYSETKKMMLLK